jgi:uncharacterized membrane protein
MAIVADPQISFDSRLAPHRTTSSPNVGTRERIASTIVGGTMVAYALARRGLVGVVVGSAGVTMMGRGITGRCAIYRRLDKDSARGISMPRDVQFSRTATIDADADQLLSQLRDPARIQRIFPSLGPIGVEEELWSLQLPVLGGHQWEWKARLVEEGDALVWRSEDGAAFEHALRVTLQDAPADRGTELRATFTGTPPGGALGAAVGQWLRKLGERSLGAALGRLKMQVETGEIASTTDQSAGQRSRTRRILGAEHFNREARS